MPHIDFSKPVTFITAVEALSLSLNCALVRLRDHANSNEQDRAALSAAAMLSAILEDAHHEVDMLVTKLERRELMMDE